MPTLSAFNKMLERIDYSHIHRCVCVYVYVYHYSDLFLP